MVRHNRRAFLQLTGTTLGAATLGVSTATATTSDSRFFINLRDVDRSEVPDDIEIIHDLSQADVLVARGDQERVNGTTVADRVINRGDDRIGAVRSREGPTTSGKGSSHNHDGSASNSEYQWDKRVQNVSNDLTDKPGNGKTIHDVTTGAGTRIAVVDTGVYDGHPDLADVVNDELSENVSEDEYDWRPNGAGSHGTHVAGIIAATNSNDGPDGGVLGTAPNTEIVSYRMFSGEEGKQGDGYAGWVKAAEAGCDAINYSVGFPAPYVYVDQYPFLTEELRIAEQVAEYVRSQGTVIVNSAGNDSLDMSPENTLSIPTEAEGVFGVAATGPIGVGWGNKHSDNEEKWLTGNRLEEPTTQPAFYTNYGGAVDVSAAGGNADLEAFNNEVPGSENDLVYSTIYETDESGNTVPGYGWKAGTSMAAPQIAGAVALVRSLRPKASVEEVESLIQETASSAPGGETYHGAGHLNLKRLVKRAGK
ncbi:Subtilase family protein [Haladaptatus litoreus]|uniref:Subtilase family protein n=1 Tax=Haladaptatus litoreus TaxID=553468 RepID=A0A1N7ENB5_9EURY|nr:S8 family serine peptidase [Haladaptatus litoreus]SIR89566.1 Subtilase family protein [Haladaptatus litoreus]